MGEWKLSQPRIANRQAEVKPLIAQLQPRRILALGAHPDDIEIGCGGTLLKLQAANPDLEIFWAVFSGTPPRAIEARNSAESYLQKHDTVQVYEFEDGYFPSCWSEIKKQFRAISKEFSPDLVFTHRLEDRHQDHRVLAELTWNEFRSQTVLEYEIAKYEGDLATNNFYCGLEKSICDTKIERLLKHFPSQATKPWFDEELFRGMLRIRGAEATGKDKYAEAFTCRKFSF